MFKKDPEKSNTSKPEKLNTSEIHERLKNCAGWQFDDEKNEIYRNYEFKTPTGKPSFKKTSDFVKQVLEITEAGGMHTPVTEFSYGFCNVHYTTHDVKGVSENDFIHADKLNKAYEEIISAKPAPTKNPAKK